MIHRSIFNWLLNIEQNIQTTIPYLSIKIEKFPREHNAFLETIQHEKSKVKQSIDFQQPITWPDDNLQNSIHCSSVLYIYIPPFTRARPSSLPWNIISRREEVWNERGRELDSVPRQ